MRKGILIGALAVGVALLFPGRAAASDATAWKTPNLSSGFTPQGMTYWYRTGPNMVIQATYKVGSNTRLVAVDPRNGSIYGQVSIAENHAGGIAIVGGWMFVQDQPHMTAEAVRRYKLTDLTKAWDKSHKDHGHPVYVKQVGKPQQLQTWQYASFMTADGSKLRAGHYGVGESSRMYTYRVDQKTGQLTAESGFMYVPDRTQGVGMLGKTPVFASHDLLTVGTKQYAIPDHAEGLVVLGHTAYVSFEGGAKFVLKYTI
jgi:hypothetical protein